MSINMSRRMSNNMSKTVKNNWNVAITDAEKKIQEAQARIRALKKSIAVFQKMRDCNEPFPIQKMSENEVKL